MFVKEFVRIVIQVLKIDGLFGSHNVVRRIVTITLRRSSGMRINTVAVRRVLLIVDFLQNSRVLPNLPLVSVSATLYDLSMQIQRLSVKIENGFIPPNYFGISQMIELGLIEDLRGIWTYTVPYKKWWGVD